MKRLGIVALMCGLSLVGLGCGGVETQERCGAGAAKCAKKIAPQWSLEDVQPQSARFGQRYGLKAFEGKVIVVALLVGWCPYCRAQAQQLETMRQELGDDVEIVVLHGASADNDEDRDALLYLDPAADPKTSRCSMPIFQDTEDINAWEQHQGVKDDFFVYAANGELWAYLPRSAGTDLNTQEGQKTLKDAVMAAKGAQ